MPTPTGKDSIPSLEDQAHAGGFEAGLFHLGRAERPGVWHFNSGLVETPDGRWLVTRRSQFHPQLHVGINDLSRVLLNGVTPVNMQSVQMPRNFCDEHFEDPRAIYHNDEIWISACNFLWMQQRRKWTGAHQVLCRFDRDWKCKARYDVPYGKNGNEIGKSTGHEKNWLWFFHENLPHLLYFANPHTVVVFGHDFSMRQVHTTRAEIPWVLGEIRGGTPPVLVGTEFWTFFHSSHPVELNGRKTRRYVMGAYAFDSQPPFAIQRMSRLPILQGSYCDPFSPDKPATAFPCGSLLKDGQWTITGGSNDLRSFWCQIPHHVVVAGTVKVRQQPSGPDVPASVSVGAR